MWLILQGYEGWKDEGTSGAQVFAMLATVVVLVCAFIFWKRWRARKWEEEHPIPFRDETNEVNKPEKPEFVSCPYCKAKTEHDKPKCNNCGGVL